MTDVLTGDLVAMIPGAIVDGPRDRLLRGITHDSRKVSEGRMFVALREAGSDGHRYIPDALKNGAAALLVERLESPTPPHVAVFRVEDTWKAYGPAAAAIYGHPSRSLTVFAVTGTNGKTSTTHLIRSICRAAGLRAGLIGTLGACIQDEWLEVPHTTPYAGDLQEMLARMREAGLQAVAMEASSHALAQHRLDGVAVSVAVFTNLTRDHLDFHGSMEEYFRAKARLFTDFADEAGEDFVSVVNVDDPVGRERLAGMARGRVVTYGLAPDAEVHASDPRSGRNGACFVLQSPGGSRKVRLKLGGLFNISNALAAAAACLARGVDIDAVCRGLEETTGVPGRFELVSCGQPFACVVDYAHTPDGLENVLSSARRLASGRVIVVFGCGGDRDRTKRPLMGEIASRLADVAVLTSDNPRSEDPAAIAEDVLQGIPQERRASLIVELDRAKAIASAVNLAREGDVVVVAGKGHETYQIFADRTIPFDDRQAVRRALTEAGYGGKEDSG